MLTFQRLSRSAKFESFHTTPNPNFIQLFSRTKVVQNFAKERPPTNELNQRTNCIRIMGENSKSEVIDIKLKDEENINIESIELKAIYTPGHTDCSYSYLMNDRVFTGDTLLINGTGRTDFQNGSAHQAYDSLFGKLLKLPEETLVYPAHDYNGKKNSTIGSEKNNNPRLQVSSKEEYAEIMDNLNLANPKMMDIAVPANLKGLTLKEL